MTPSSSSMLTQMPGFSRPLNQIVAKSSEDSDRIHQFDISKGTVMRILAAIAAISGVMALPGAAVSQTPEGAATLYEGCKWMDGSVDLVATPPIKLSFRWQACDGKQAA